MDDLSELGLTGTAGAAYLEALAGRRTLTGDDPELGELEAAELAHRDVDGVVRLNSPRRAVDRWAQREEDRVRRMRVAAESWEDLYRGLRDGRRSAVDVVTGRAAAGQVFAEVQSAARQQIRALDRGPYLEVRSQSPGPTQLQQMADGVAYRVVYDDEAFQMPDLREEIYGAVVAGEQSRVFAGVPTKAVIADDDRAILAHPRPGQEPEVIIVEQGLLLDALVETFELLWRLAIEVTVPARGQVATTQEPSEETRALLRGLAAGLTDDAIARELGLSERTVHRRIRRLQDLLAARSRFQLGIQAVRRGWL